MIDDDDAQPPEPGTAIEPARKVIERGGERYDAQGHRLCHAMRRRTTIPCSNPAMIGRDYCRIHGGRMPTGPALPQFKHGRYSRALGGHTTLREAFEAGRENAELISLRDLIALHEGRIEELLTRLGPNSGADWERALVLARGYVETLARDPGNAATALQALVACLEEGASAEVVWNKLLRTAESRRKLTDTETRTEEKLHQRFTVSAAQAFGAAMATLARQYVAPEKLDEFIMQLRLATLNAIDSREEMHKEGD